LPGVQSKRSMRRRTEHGSVRIKLQKKEINMNRNILEGNWKQIRGTIREKWGELTDDELDQIAGKRDKLAGVLQERYGYTQMEAERQIDDFLDTWEDTDHNH
jgi:uncharacterized protein YjbJ (UPF0337 family)